MHHVMHHAMHHVMHHVMQVSSTDALLAYFTWYSEATVHYRLAAASVAAGKYIGKSVYVMDMRGFGISKFG